MPFIKEKKHKTHAKSKVQIRKKTPNPCEMEPFHQFGSCSSTSDSISSSNSEDEETPRTRTNRFQSFQPFYRGKRKTYVRSTSKMNLSRRLSYRISKSEPQTPIRAFQIEFTPNTIHDLKSSPVTVSVQSKRARKPRKKKV